MCPPMPRPCAETERAPTHNASTDMVTNVLRIIAVLSCEGIDDLRKKQTPHTIKAKADRVRGRVFYLTSLEVLMMRPTRPYATAASADNQKFLRVSSAIRSTV